MVDTEIETIAERDEDRVFDSVPSIVFDNRTKYSAIHFNTVDQHEQAFHVFVLKQAFEIEAPNASGLSPLRVSANAAELVFEDSYLDGGADGSVAYESDLAPYKPKCDVIVKGSAHAAAGRALSQIDVRLKLQSGAETLIDKPLTVLGERSYKRAARVMRTAAVLAKATSIGLLRPSSWIVTEPSPFTSLPMRYEFAVGGAVRIAKADPASASIPEEHRLGESETGDAAHQVCESNPLGRGFAPLWYLTVTRKAELPAPRIVYPSETLNAARFWDSVNGKALPRPAGFGPIGRAWLPRRRLFGKFEEKSTWCERDVPRLPMDFDYSYWNCAPEDQQCKLLRFGEVFTLQNLFKADHPAVVLKDGVGVVRFALPQQAFPLLAGNATGEVRYARLHIDTVFIDADLGRVELVWRGSIDADGRFSDVRVMHLEESSQIRRLDTAESVGIVQMKTAARREE